MAVAALQWPCQPFLNICYMHRRLLEFYPPDIIYSPYGLWDGCWPDDQWCKGSAQLYSIFQHFRVLTVSLILFHGSYLSTYLCIRFMLSLFTDLCSLSYCISYKIHSGNRLHWCNTFRPPSDKFKIVEFVVSSETSKKQLFLAAVWHFWTSAET